ncbi:MAG: hypothetical protein HQM09_05905 [Candidatus Riflebacteria bacterium]|nr:hypothetical protein [Candidatus Riflebacteria bacterium]
MGLIETWAKYRVLDARQREFINSRQRVCVLTKKEWFQFLRPLAEFDMAGDRMRGGLGCSIFVCFFIGMITLVLFPPLGVLLWIATFVIWIIYRMLAKRDLNNNLREFILPLVEILSQDMDSDAGLKMRIDLRGFDIDSKRISHREENTGWFAPYPRTIENQYQDPWLEGETRLADGTTLSWKITDHIRKREVTSKRTGVSKTKIRTKTKYKIRQMLQLRLAPKHDRYVLACPGSGKPELESAQGDSGVTSGDRIAHRLGNNRHVLTSERFHMESQIDHVFPKDLFVKSLGELFMRVRPISGESKG